MTELGDRLALRDRCEEEGRKAHLDGVRAYENPYFRVDQHEERSSWADGWWGEEDGQFLPLSMTPKTKGQIKLNPSRCGNLENPMKVA